MTDKEYIKGLLEEINICNQIISKYEELTNDYKHEIERLNNEYNKAFERLKSQQREIDRLKEENEFLDRTDEDRYKEAESTIRASIANAGTSCRWCEETIRKNTVKEFAQKIKDGVADYLYKTNFDGHKDNIVDIFELCEIVDSTVKEYEII